MITPRKLILLIVYLLIISENIYPITMESEIEIEITGSDLVKAKEETVQGVILKIIEKYIQSRIEFSIFESNYNYINEQVIKYSKDYIAKYNIVDSKITGKKYYLRLNAEVKDSELNKKLESIGFFISTKRKPTICILLSQKEKDKTDFWWQNVDKEKDILTKQLESNFKKMGFSISEFTEIFRQTKYQKYSLLPLELFEIGNKIRSDYIIYGNSQKTRAQKLSFKSSISIFSVKDKKEIGKNEILSEDLDATNLITKNADGLFSFAIQKVSESWLLLNAKKDFLDISFSNVTSPAFYKKVTSFIASSKGLFDEISLKRISNKKIIYRCVTSFGRDKLIERLETADWGNFIVTLNKKSDNLTLDFNVSTKD